MEVVGAIAAIVQLAGTVTQLSIKLYHVCDTLGSADEELQSLRSELSLFGQVLTQLSVLLKEDESRYTEPVYFTTAKTIESCGDIHSEIDAMISRSNEKNASMNQDGSSTSIAARFRWAFRQRKIKLWCSRLNAMKINLLINIQVMQLCQITNQLARNPPTQSHEKNGNSNVRETLHELQVAGEASIARLSVLEEEDQAEEAEIGDAGVKEAQEQLVNAIGESQEGPSTSTLQTFHSALSEQDSVWLRDAFQMSNASVAGRFSQEDNRIEIRSNKNKQVFPFPWLTPWSVDHLQKHQTIRRSRHPGTGLQFIKTNEFQSWEESSQTSLLLLHGSPGTGKTVSTSAIIDRYWSRIGHHTALAYHYCQHFDARTANPTIMMSSLLNQLLQPVNVSQEIESSLRKCYQQDNLAPKFEEVVALVRAVTQLYGEVIIVIDGIDEIQLDDQKRVYSTLQVLSQTKGPVVKLVVTSSDASCVQNFPSAIQLFDLKVLDCSEDMSIFIDTSLKLAMDSGALLVRDPTLKSEIKEALLEGAKGRFLWVFLQLDRIGGLNSDTEIRDLLRDLPKDLFGSYEAVLKDISGSTPTSHLNYIHRILERVACARRPLRLDELREAISFTPDSRTWSSGIQPENMFKLISECKNLVAIDELDDTVRLIHFSLLEFLEVSVAYPSVSRFHFTIAEANRHLGEVCVAYLLFGDFDSQVATTSRGVLTANFGIYSDAIRYQRQPQKSIFNILVKLRLSRVKPLANVMPVIDIAQFAPVKGISVIDELARKYRFLEYALENWTGHTVDLLPGTSPCFKSFERLAIGKVPIVQARPWATAHQSDTLPYLPMFLWALDAGHVPLLTLLSSQGAGLSLKAYVKTACEKYQGRLLIACRKGLTDVMRLLIDALDGSIPDLTSLTAEAAANGHTEIVEILRDAIQKSD